MAGGRYIVHSLGWHCLPRAEISMGLITGLDGCSYNIYNVNFGHYQGYLGFITVVMIKNTTYSGSLSVDSRLVVWYSQPKLVRQKELIKSPKKLAL